MTPCNDEGVKSTAANGRPRPVTQEDVARAVGVSRTLVSFAFRGAPGVSSETRQTILDTARRLGYRHNAAAADLARKAASAVGLYLLDIRNEAYADMFAGVRDALRDGPSRLILSIAETLGSVDDGAVGSLIEARVGIVIAATLLDSDDEIRRLAGSVPLVSLARRVEGVDSVYSDDHAGAVVATEHLLSLGHERVAHVSGPRHEGHEGRWRGYEQAMRRAGRTPRTVFAEDYTQVAGEAAAGPLLTGPDRPTAVFAHNDEIALGIREAAAKLGLAVPADLSLVGYDDSRIARLRGIELTSMDLHALELGRKAGTAALARLADPSGPVVDRRLEARIMVRGSTAPPPAV